MDFFPFPKNPVVIFERNDSLFGSRLGSCSGKPDWRAPAIPNTLTEIVKKRETVRNSRSTVAA